MASPLGEAVARSVSRAVSRRRWRVGTAPVPHKRHYPMPAAPPTAELLDRLCLDSGKRGRLTRRSCHEAAQLSSYRGHAVCPCHHCNLATLPAAAVVLVLTHDSAVAAGQGDSGRHTTTVSCDTV